MTGTRSLLRRMARLDGRADRKFPPCINERDKQRALALAHEVDAAADRLHMLERDAALRYVSSEGREVERIILLSRLGCCVHGVMLLGDLAANRETERLRWWRSAAPMYIEYLLGERAAPPLPFLNSHRGPPESVDPRVALRLFDEHRVQIERESRAGQVA